jgi:glucans biosynthesis protein C
MADTSTRNLWVDYLRSALTVLVVAHHSSLAYTSFAWFDPNAYINSTHPIVDRKRWIGLDIFENFNDVFFMSLMFLIGGLFLIRSIRKKGAFQFIRDRFYRLFVPFLFLGTLLMLIAYFPSYYIAHQSTDIIAYIKDFFTLEKWPVGPPWFIWVLFVFNLVFALFSAFYLKLSSGLNKRFSLIKNRPLLVFVALFCFTWLVYVPVAYTVGAGTWTGIGPFDFQLSRILLYFGYFSLGVLIGNTDFNNGLFSTAAALVKRWRIWLLMALGVYVLLITVSRPLTQLVMDHKIKELNAWMIYYSIYVSSCALSCIAFITIFKKAVYTEKRWWNSLSEQAYTIYMVHYVFVVWCQFLLMKYNIPAFVKFIITFTTALALSWWISSVVRKIKIIR